MPTTAEEPGGRRRALVVATGTYADATLSRLRAPGGDASKLAEVLQDERIGGFHVETVLDAPADALRRRVARFCAQGAPADLALLYLSCHGVLDDRGRLYYATTDTDHALLSATAVPAAWLNEQLEDCRCRRQILVLDCCHSGAFAKGAKGEGGLALRERFEGRGRVVLTASRGTEYSFEAGEVHGDGVSSVFTGVLVEGLRSGDADRDRDGLVTVGELYDYAYEAVRTTDGRQNPTLWTYGAEGDMLVAQSPRGAVVEPAPLPDDLVELLESARPRVREGAVAELAELLTGPHPGRALAARACLERIAAEDIPRVAGAARTALGKDGAAAAPSAPTSAATGSGQSPPSPPAHPSSRPVRKPWRRPPVLVAAALGAAALVAVAVLALSGGGSAEPPVPAGAIAVSGSPRGVAVGQGAVWVTSHDSGKLSRIDPTTGTKSFRVGPKLGRIAIGEGVIWVVGEDGRRLFLVDPRTRKVSERVPVDLRQGDCGCPPGGLVIADGALWAAAPRRGAVLRYDLRTGTEAGTFELGAGFEGYFAIGGGALWAVENRPQGGRSWLVRIELDSGERERINLGSESYFSGVAYGEGAVWITDSDDAQNVVTRFDPETEGTTNAKVATGVSAEDIAVASGAVLVWEPGDGHLTRIDPETTEATGSQTPRGYRTGAKLNGVASDLAVANGSAWVSDPAAGLIHKLDY